MTRNIMLLFDSFSVRGEAVQYSIELARRMDSTLVFLMILPLDSEEEATAESDWVSNLKARIKEAIVSHMENAEETGVSVEAFVRMGDPSSELMKFLAGSRTFQTIVWGGDEDLTNKKAQKKKAHWLVKMKDVVECPVLIPSIKS